MNDDMFRPSCGHHQVLQIEIQYHKMITHLHGIPLVLHLYLKNWLYKQGKDKNHIKYKR